MSNRLFDLAMDVLFRPRVSVKGLRYTIDDTQYLCKVMVENNLRSELFLTVSVRFKIGGDYLCVYGRDKFTLLTQRSLADKRAYPEHFVRAGFPIAGKAVEDVEVLCVSKGKGRLSFFDELGKIDLPVADYVIELEICGAGTVIRHEIKCPNSLHLGHVYLKLDDCCDLAMPIKERSKSTPVWDLAAE